jgi:hypothetical protein
MTTFFLATLSGKRRFENYSVNNPEIEFLRKYGKDFEDEFKKLSKDDTELQEYLTKIFFINLQSCG